MTTPPLAVPEFRPTAEEFSNFHAFVKRIEPLCPAGAAQIRPPPGWQPRKNLTYDDLNSLVIRRPIRQEIVGSKGVFVAMHVVQPKRTLEEFRRDADRYHVRCAPPPLEYVYREETSSGLRDAGTDVANSSSLGSPASDKNQQRHQNPVDFCEDKNRNPRTKQITAPHNGQQEIGHFAPESQQDRNLLTNQSHFQHDELQAEAYLQGPQVASPSVHNLNDLEKHFCGTPDMPDSSLSHTQRNFGEDPVSVRAKPVPVPTEESLSRMDTFFWRNVLFRQPMYGADLEGSLFEDDVCNEWNLNKLESLLDLCPTAAGVHNPYLYIGMFGSLFCFHVEDADLYGINYLHVGAPKTWYTIPPSHRARFDALCERLYPDHFLNCKQFMRHKQMLVSLDVLKKNSIPYGRVTQLPGTFTIVLPGVYHCGFNHGFNVAEAVNFATLRWLNIGKKASACLCQEDTVRIDVEAIDRQLFPGKYTAEFAERSRQIESIVHTLRRKTREAGRRTPVKNVTTNKKKARNVHGRANQENIHLRRNVANPSRAEETKSSFAAVGINSEPSPIVPNRWNEVVHKDAPVSKESDEVQQTLGTADAGKMEAVPCMSNGKKFPSEITEHCSERTVCAVENTPNIPVSHCDEDKNTFYNCHVSNSDDWVGIASKSGEQHEQEKSVAKRRRNWALIPVLRMSDFAVRAELRGPEREKAVLDRATMCGVEIQLLAANTLLNTLNIVLRDIVDRRRIAAIGRKISKTRRRFLNVQVSLFDRCPSDVGKSNLNANFCEDKLDKNVDVGNEHVSLADINKGLNLTPLCDNLAGRRGDISIQLVGGVKRKPPKIAARPGHPNVSAPSKPALRFVPERNIPILPRHFPPVEALANVDPTPFASGAMQHLGSGCPRNQPVMQMRPAQPSQQPHQPHQAQHSQSQSQIPNQVDFSQHSQAPQLAKPSQHSRLQQHPGSVQLHRLLHLSQQQQPPPPQALLHHQYGLAMQSQQSQHQKPILSQRPVHLQEQPQSQIQFQLRPQLQPSHASPHSQVLHMPKSVMSKDSTSTISLVDSWNGWNGHALNEYASATRGDMYRFPNDHVAAAAVGWGETYLQDVTMNLSEHNISFSDSLLADEKM